MCSLTLPDNLKDWESVAKIAAVIVGGLWVYVGYFRGRTFKSRLDLSIEGERYAASSVPFLAVVIKAKNLGLSKFVINRQLSCLRIFAPKPTLGSVHMIKPLAWMDQPVAVVPAFTASWIEPGETVIDDQLFQVPNIVVPALKLELLVVREGILSFFQTTTWVQTKIVKTEVTKPDAVSDSSTP